MKAVALFVALAGAGSLVAGLRVRTPDSGLATRVVLPLPGRFPATQGRGGVMAATVVGEVCQTDGYVSSALEQRFLANPLKLTNTTESLCEALRGTEESWIESNLKSTAPKEASPTPEVFSRLCKKGLPPQRLEPLAGALRDPRFLCKGEASSVEWPEFSMGEGVAYKTRIFTAFSVEWLVVADKDLAPNGKKIFFDAGGTNFMDAMRFFTSEYQERGITFDKVYVWEATKTEPEKYWMGTPKGIRAFWEPRLTFYNGVPIVTESASQNNPIKRINTECRPDDFCVFKLDVDTPAVEMPIVEQLLAGKANGKLDEFFFEHHVAGLMQTYGWGAGVEGTFADSYRIFLKLRKQGIRAHSWI